MVKDEFIITSYLSTLIQVYNELALFSRLFLGIQVPSTLGICHGVVLRLQVSVQIIVIQDVIKASKKPLCFKQIPGC